MSISGSMYTGVSGLHSHSEAMSVISDNIANVNTTGFKASRANFSDILGGVIAGDRVGNGSAITSVQTMFTQGALLGTGNTMDLAIQGEGFFMVTPPGGSAPLYTRAGQFQIDDQGYVVNPQGMRVLGYGVDTAGQLGSATSPLQVPTTALPPSATSTVSLQANLGSQEPVATAPFDLANPDSTSQYQTAVTVYDSVGEAHQLELYFTKTSDGPQQWEVNVTASGADIVPAPAGDRALLATGTLAFNPDGSLASNTLPAINATWSGAEAASITLDLGSATGAGGTGVDGLTGYAGNSAASFITQDGNSSGDLGGLEIGNDGQIVGLYSNGESRVIGQLATAKFVAPDGLQRMGGGLYAATIDAGEPTVAPPGAGGHGSIVSGSLEGSNVDLAAEFVQLIAVQRGFQSNSRSITTADEMLSELVNLKR